METSEDYMAHAMRLAAAAARAGEVPVGAVVVDPATGTVVAEGANRPRAAQDPTAHAEIVALRAAAEQIGNYRLNGLDLYVTLEPCAMCAGAISLARIRKLVFAACDVKGGAVVNGPRFFEQPTCHWRPEIVQETAYAEAAGDALKQFFAERRKRGRSPVERLNQS